MILNASGRTDIVAFYTPWFMNRYHEGFLDVRNPFNRDMVSRINFDDVDLISFCTKNPAPIVKRIGEIEKPIQFQVTLTAYGRDIEPQVPLKARTIKYIKKIAPIIGKENITIRYDPILFNDKYDLEYHIDKFDKYCKSLNGYADRLTIHFVDDYKNVRRNRDVLSYREVTDNDYKVIGENFARSAKENDMTVFACFEDRNLCEYGFSHDECLSPALAYKLTGKEFPRWTAREGNKCHCVQMVDVGEYNTCSHFCKYCYANYDEKRVRSNCKVHYEDSSLLIGRLKKNDVIKLRKD